MSGDFDNFVSSFVSKAQRVDEHSVTRKEKKLLSV